MCCSIIWLMYHKVTSCTLGITLPSLCPKFCYFILNTSSNPQWIHFQLSACTHKSEDALRAKMSAYNQITFLRFSYFWTLSPFLFPVITVYVDFHCPQTDIFTFYVAFWFILFGFFIMVILNRSIGLSLGTTYHPQKFFLNSFFSTMRIGILSSLILSLVPRS